MKKAIKAKLVKANIDSLMNQIEAARKTIIGLNKAALDYKTYYKDFKSAKKMVSELDKADTALTNAYNAAIDFEEKLNPRGG